MQEEVEGVFCNVLLVCDQLGLLGGSHFSLDGVKLSANVSKELSGTFDELKHKRDKLQEKLKQVVAEHLQADKQPEIEQERQEKRERRLQLQIERLNAFLESEQPKQGRDGNEIQSNAVDNESVKMPTSHGVLQGYNAQALVDSKHQVILAAEAFSSQDHENLEPMVKGAKENLGVLGKPQNFFQGKQLTADSNYHSFESLTFCQSEGVDAYIPDIQFRKRDERFAEQCQSSPYNTPPIFTNSAPLIFTQDAPLCERGYPDYPPGRQKAAWRRQNAKKAEVYGHPRKSRR
jgi:hypothetical protein